MKTKRNGKTFSFVKAKLSFFFILFRLWLRFIRYEGHNENDTREKNENKNIIKENFIIILERGRAIIEKL